MNRKGDDLQVAIKEPDIDDVANLDSKMPSIDREPTRIDRENKLAKNSSLPAPRTAPEKKESFGNLVSKEKQPRTKPDQIANSGEKFGFPEGSDSLIAAPNKVQDSLAATKPARTPYDLTTRPDVMGESLKNAASDLSRDIDKMSADARARLEKLSGDKIDQVASGADRLAMQVENSSAELAGAAATSASRFGGQFKMPDNNSSSASSGAAGGSAGETPAATFTLPSRTANVGIGNNAQGAGARFVSVKADSTPLYPASGSPSMQAGENPSAFSSNPSRQNLPGSATAGSSGMTANSSPSNSSTLSTMMEPMTPPATSGATVSNQFPSTGFGQFGSAGAVPSSGTSSSSSASWSNTTPPAPPPQNRSATSTASAAGWKLPAALSSGAAGAYRPGATAGPGSIFR